MRLRAPEVGDAPGPPGGRRGRSRCGRWASTSRRAWPRRSTGPRRWPSSVATTSTRPRWRPRSGTVLKYREDQERVRQSGIAELVAPGLRAAAPTRWPTGEPARDGRSAFARRAAGRRPGRAARQRRSPSPRRSAPSGWPSGDAGRTGPGGRPWCTGPRTSPSTTGSSPSFWEAGAGHSRVERAEPEPLRLTLAVDDEDADGADDEEPDEAGDEPTISLRCQPARGAAPQGLRRLHRRPSSTRRNG